MRAARVLTLPLLATLACGLLCSPSGAAARVGAADGQDEWDLPVIDALVAGRLAQLCERSEGGQPLQVDPIAAELLAQAPVLAECLASVLTHGAWRVPAQRNEPAAVFKLTRGREDIVRDLARRLPPLLLVEHARRALAPEVPCTARRAALVLLGTVARARDVSLLIDLASLCAPAQVERELERALTESLQRNAAACRELEGHWKQVPEDLRLPVLRALAHSCQPEALPILAARLDDQPELTLAVLSLTGTLAARLACEPDEQSAAAVRARLASPRADVRREAALAAGRLQDSESAPRLIEMLEAEDRGERDAANWALQEISLMSLSAEPLPWKLWLASEQLWWAREWPQCREGLAAPDPAQVVASLDSLARRRLHRAELAAAVAATAESGAAEFHERRCHVLGALRSRAGLDCLRERLDSPDPAVSAAAAAAWQATTGHAPADGPAARGTAPE